MSPLRHPSAWLSCLALAGLALPCQADAPPADPLRLVPARADFVLKVEQPRQLLEGFTSLPAWKQLQELDGFREFYDSTNFRRFYQLVGYFEKKLGGSYPDLLDRLAGGGAALAVKFEAEGDNKAAVLLVVQGKDEKLTREFVTTAVEVIEGELGRLESKERIQKVSYRGIEALHVGGKFILVAVGPTLLLATSDKAIKAGLDLHLDGPARSLAGSPQLAEARKVLPPGARAWLYLNLEPVKKAPQFKVAFDTFTADPSQTIITGAFADVLRRSPFLCGSLSQDSKGYFLTFRMPRGQEGMAEAPALLQPQGNRGSLPLLEPKDVLVSVSYHLDLSKFWENRAKVLNQKQLENLEKAEKNSGPFLGGIKLGKLLKQTGPHQRFLVVQQPPSTVYKTAAKSRQPAYALVQETTDPAFGKNMETVLRAVALFVGNQFSLKMVEEKHGEVMLVTYRFPEDGKYKNDPQGIRYNFSPCFAQVGNQFFVSSTVELGRELIGLLQKEAGSKKSSPATLRTQLYSSGGAALLRSIQEQLVTQAVLAQAMNPDTARQQVEAFINLVDRLGTLRIDSTYGANDYHLDIRVNLAK